MEAFELDSYRTSNLGRRIQRNFFECFSCVLQAEFLQNFDVLKKLCRMRGGMPSIYSGFKGRVPL